MIDVNELGARERLFNIKIVVAITSVPESSIWQLIKEEKFPKPYKISVRRDVWKESELMAYMDSLSHDMEH
jgi:predicted DNA-binding transcriptional regulator AlpA